MVAGYCGFIDGEQMIYKDYGSEAGGDILLPLSDFVAQLEFSRLPSDVIAHLRLFLADYVAASYAGLTVGGATCSLVTRTVLSEKSTSVSSFFGASAKVAPSQASYLNAFISHSADLDDGNKRAAGHIGTHVFSSVLALAESKGSSWMDVAVSTVAGYEVFNRVAAAAQPSLYRHGFHSTGVAGSIASAAACAKLLGLGQEKIYDAMALGALQSSGLIIIDETAQQAKPLNAANAARSGLLSALFAAQGLKGPVNALNHPEKGWFKAFSGCSQPDIACFDGLGRSFTILNSYLKLYPACRHTHAVIDAAIELRGATDFKRDSTLTDINKVIVSIYPSAIRSAGKIAFPRDCHEAKFSIAYCFAVAYLTGDFSLSNLDPETAPADASKLAGCVELAIDESLENKDAGTRGARVRILGPNCDCEITVLVPKGERGGMPLTWDDMRNKMRSSFGYGNEAIADKVIDGCINLDFSGEYDPELIFAKWEDDRCL